MGLRGELSVRAFTPDLEGLTRESCSRLPKSSSTFLRHFPVLVRSRVTAKEKIMNPTRIPGNEPDPGDMSTEPETGTPNGNPNNHDLPDEAENLGDFA